MSKKVEFIRSGVFIYLIAGLLISSRYFLVLDLNDLSISVWDAIRKIESIDSRLELLFFSIGLDLMLHAFFNPLLIPVYDWYHRNNKLSKSFTIYDFATIICFVVEIAAWSWLAFIYNGEPYKFLESWKFFVLVGAFSIQMILYFYCRENKADKRSGLKTLLIVPALISIPLFLAGLLYSAFIIGYTP